MVDTAGTDRLPPQSRDAERSVIGSMLRDNSVINDVFHLIDSPESFYFDAHQKIFLAIKSIYDNGHPVDILILSNHLQQAKQLEDVGGSIYLAELWEAAPTAANAEYYAKIVREKAIIRGLIHASTEILRDSYDQAYPAEELLGAAERRVLDIADKGVTSNTYTLQKALHDAYTRIDQRAGRQDPNAISGIATGFIDLDHLMAGMQNSELIILAARPSVGKTAMALNIVRHVSSKNNTRSCLSAWSRRGSKWRNGSWRPRLASTAISFARATRAARTIGKLHAAGDVLRNAQLFIDDSPSQGMLRIAANARRLKIRNQIRLVVIDYLQLIDPENRRDPRQEQVAQISRRLKHLARELEIPVMALAQVNRSSEDRQDHRPRLADLRESGSIEQDADTCLMLHRPGRFDGGQEDNIIEVIVAKQRNGPTGDVTLAWLSKYMRFENYAGDGTFGME